MVKMKEPKTFRLSVRTVALLEKLAEINDTTMTRIIEEAVREKARREKVAEDALHDTTREC